MTAMGPGSDFTYVAQFGPRFGHTALNKSSKPTASDGDQPGIDAHAAQANSLASD